MVPQVRPGGSSRALPRARVPPVRRARAALGELRDELGFG